jgi:phenylalanyl-tRNA synthetase alpha chain
MNDLLERGEAQLAQGLESVRAAASDAELAQAKAQYLGKKGSISSMFREMGSLSAEERPAFGQHINAWKDELEAAVRERALALRIQGIESAAGPAVDVTMPGLRPEMGSVHPVTRTWADIEDIFASLGYSVAEGPEIETDVNNFQKLNMPADHPARDMHDTFYVGQDLVLRTHTSPVQVRVMEARKPPIRIIAPGAVYRRDSDLTHTPMFHQVEGLAVGPDVTFADLKGTLEAFIRELFGPKAKLRFRPSYFPFTEPSAEVDMTCSGCGGSGCRICKDSGWLEVLGCGMVHPQVFADIENDGYDPDQVQGFAFGMGIDRIAMLRYGIDDLRILFEGDLRLLDQFGGW